MNFSVQEAQEKKAMTAPTPPASALVRPFTVSISDSEIDDLKQRLARTRWPDPETVGDWSQGVRVENARSLAGYWERGYDWRRLESGLNRFPQFLTEIDGLDIHFIHVRSNNPHAMPLILTHGWPSSIVDFLKLIGPLTDPVSSGGDAADSFDVVVPSLPGFGFSQKPTETGWNVSRIASAWVELMKRLGYTRWAAQGGDWGAVVTTALGAMQPEGLAGIHLNTQFAFPAQIPGTLSPEQRYAVQTLALYTGDLGGANHLQGTKPETAGFALADSPAGHQQRSIVRPHLLGEQIDHCRRPEADASGRGDRLPEGHPTPATKLDRRHLQQSDPLRRGRQGRALRRPGTARDPGQRNPHRPAHPSFLTPTRDLRSARVSPRASLNPPKALEVQHRTGRTLPVTALADRAAGVTGSRSRSGGPRPVPSAIRGPPRPGPSPPWPGPWPDR